MSGLGCFVLETRTPASLLHFTLSILHDIYIYFLLVRNCSFFPSPSRFFSVMRPRNLIPTTRTSGEYQGLLGYRTASRKKHDSVFESLTRREYSENEQ